MDSLHVVVVGGGAVGLGCALFLQADGHRVTLIDRAEPGQATSLGNAGIISVQTVQATGTPDVLRQLPKLLVDAESPLRIRWRDLWATAPWLLAFLAHCRPAPAAAAARAQVALCSRAGTAWQLLLQRCGGNDRVTWNGWLKLAESEAEARSYDHPRRLLAEAGHDAEWLDGDGVAELEPALAPRFVGGLWLKGNGQVDRPHELLRMFAARFVADGGTIVADETREIDVGGVGVVVRGAAGDHAADRAVLAAGPWSARLARRLGCRVRLVAERGYHLMLEQEATQLRRALYSTRLGFALAPMGPYLRLTHGAEIARLDTPPDERRIRRLLPEVRRWLPTASVEVASSWLGRRPSTPDSLPVIGPAPASAKVILAYGHNHVGLTQGPITGRLVADLVAGRAPEIDLRPYAPDR